jgi:hypothetical protein
MTEAYEWKLNASTGNFIARVSSNVRLVRVGRIAPFLYRAENWGDYSLEFPVCSPWCSSPKAALKALNAGAHDLRR